LCLAFFVTGTTALAKTETRSFSIGGRSGDRQEFRFEAKAVGTIRVEARWTGAPEKLTLILNGPGQTGYYQRLEAASPLVVVQDVTRDILSRGTDWKVAVVNFGRTAAVKGTLAISYPEEFQVQRYDRLDRITVSAVEKAAGDRAIVTVDYEIRRPHAKDVFVGAAVVEDGAEIASFGFRPAPVTAGSGQARVEIIYQGGAAPGRISSDQIAVYLYEGDRKPTCRFTHDLSLSWYK
jgi:hypothetical protein